MKITISDIEEGIDLEFSEHLLQNSILKTLGPVLAHLRINRHGDEVQVKGEIHGVLQLQCSRCLIDFNRDLSFGVDLVYHSFREIKKEEIHQISDDDSNIGFYSSDELDITQIVREQLILRLLMKPLCNESCKGLCSVCGIDLNLQQCDCKRESIDLRIGALKKLSSLRKEN